MSEQLSFFSDSPDELHQKVVKELKRIQGEDWEDFNEVVRYEVNERLKEQRSNNPKPDYKHSKIIY